MSFYKKIVPKQMRFKILSMLKFIPDKPMLKMQYFIKNGRFPNLKNPRRFTEKIQWYKLFYRNDKMPICVDKYRVREYIEEKGLSDILVKLYGVYDRPEDIDFSVLPDRFVLKTTNGSGTNFICKNKSEINKEEVMEKFSSFFKQSGSSAGREWAYSFSSKKIIAEEYLEDNTSEDGSICDYKFFCFNGKPEYIAYDVGRFSNHTRNTYDTEWNEIDVAINCPKSDKKFPKPDTLDEMLRIVKILCEDFPHVRVDLYSINGKIYFGELTFFPGSGYSVYKPDSFDFEMGEKFILPEKNN